MSQGGFIRLNSEYVLHCHWANGQRSATNEISVLLALVIVYLREVETFDPVRAYFPFRQWLHYDSVPTNFAATSKNGRSWAFMWLPNGLCSSETTEYARHTFLSQ